MIKGMSIETASRYVLVMDQIEKIVDKIHCMAYMMSLCCEIEEGQVEIRVHCVGYLGKMIATDVLRITECLDNEFASILEVRQAVEDEKP
ncbi:MAG: hypothetical protein SV375_13750 [Thermodesulfobacteriota bacterium]|nr:hypothetical protein [Thermodesulfobacteriota bacterium]